MKNFTVITFFQQLLIWIFLYFLPISFALLIAYIFTRVLKFAVLKAESRSIKEREELTFEERREAMVKMSVKIHFMFKVFFISTITIIVVMAFVLLFFDEI